MSRHGPGFVVCATALTLVSLVAARPCSVRAGEGLAPEVLAKVKAATIFLRVKKRAQNECQGSAFLILDNIAVTNAHVLCLEDGKPPEEVYAILRSGVKGDERRLRAELLGYDTHWDLAFIRLAPVAVQKEGVLLPEPLPVASANDLKETQPVFILGFPFGERLAQDGTNPGVTVGSGSVSSFRRSKGGRIEAVQINGDLNPGNSGGPIVNSKGEVVAVSVATIRGSQIGFGIPADQVTLCLQGRAAQVTLHDVRRVGEAYNFAVTIAVVDPLRKVKGMELYYWTSWESSGRPRDPVSGTPLHGARGDRDRQTLVLQLDAHARWIGYVKGLVIGRREELWLQPVASGGGPAQPLNPLTVAEAEFVGMVGRDRTLEPGEANPADDRKLPPLPSEVVQDEQGRSYSKATTKAEEVELRGLVALAASPSGTRLYAALKDVPAVKVLDAETLDDLGQLPCPSPPVDVWCGEKRVAVACPKAGSIVVFDTTEQKQLFSAELRGAPSAKPHRLVGADADGALLGLWAEAVNTGSKELREGTWQEMMVYPLRHLVEVTDKGEARKVYSLPEPKSVVPPGEMALYSLDWLVWRGAQWPLVAQASSRYGQPLTSVFQLQPKMGRLIPLDLKKLGIAATRFGCAAASRDGKQVLLPVVTDQGVTVTHVLDETLSKVLARFPGTPVRQLPGGSQWVIYVPTTVGTDIVFMDSADWHVVRRVVSAFPGGLTFLRDQRCELGGFAIRLYLPKPDRLVEVYARDLGRLYTYRCGPFGVPKPVDMPGVVYVGEPVEFTLTFKPPDGANTVRFRVKDPLPGLTVDAKSGKIAWTPTAASLGAYDITFLATVDGKETQVCIWKVEIRAKRK